MDKQNGIVIPPRNTDDLVEAIRFMYNHPEQREKMGRKNVETVVNNYSAEQYINSLRSIYRSCEI